MTNTDTRPTRVRREYGIATLAMAAGAALLLFASGRVWVTGLLGSPGPVAPVSVEVTGGDLTGALSGLGWAGLAAIAGLYAARSWPRRVVGALVAACGVFAFTALWSATRPETLLGAVTELATDASGTGEVVGTPEISALGPIMAAVGALLLTSSGVAALVRAPVWPGMGNRYDRDAAPRPRQAHTPADLWKSLDAGDDPTLDVPGDGTPTTPVERAEPGDATEPTSPADRPAEPKENN